MDHEFNAFAINFTDIFHCEVGIKRKNLAFISLYDPNLIENGKNRKTADQESNYHYCNEWIYGIFLFSVLSLEVCYLFSPRSHGSQTI